MSVFNQRNMRKFSIFTTIFAFFASMLVAQPASAGTLNLLTSETAQHEIIIRGFTGTMPAELVIPSEIDSKPVVAIGEMSFIGATLGTLKLSEGIRTVGQQAFSRAWINNVELPSTLETIESQGFDTGSYLSSVKFSGNAPSCQSSCLKLYDQSKIYAYEGAQGFGNTWQGTPVTYLSRTTYTLDSNEATITGYVGTPGDSYVIPATLEGAPVVAIADDAFSGKGLKSVKIPKTVRTIGARAFAGNELTSLVIPASVTDIGAMAFALNPSLGSVTFNGNAPTSGGSLFAFTSPQMTSLTIRPGSTGFGSLYEMFPLIEVAAPSDVAILSLLAPMQGSFTPAFNPDVLSYSMTVPYATNAVELLPNPESAWGTVTINGDAVDGWTPSLQFLNVGENTFEVTCTAQDGETKVTYTVVVTRQSAPSNDSSAKSIVPSVGSLTQTGWLDYSVSVPSNINSMQITATVNESHATMKVQGVDTPSGQAKDITLAVGANIVDIEVTAQNGTNKTTYRITVTRAAPVVLSSDAKLSGLALDKGSLAPSFSNTTTSYQSSVGFSTTSLKVTPTVSESHATLKVNGTSATSGSAKDIALEVGVNTITIEVTAQDGSTKKTYTLSVTRASASTTATLSGLLVKNISLSSNFSAGTLNYTASVGYGVTNYTVKATLSDANAQLKVNGATATSGVESGSVSLATGSNTITIEVTAQDGSTKKTYIVTVTRAAANTNAGLSALTFSGITISPAFATATTAYTATVPYSIGSVSLTATLAAATSSLKVAGAAATSGVSFSGVPLKVGQNVIAIEVTSESGSKKTYNVTITRTAASTDASLKLFEPKAGAFAEAFSASKYSYSQSVINGVSQIQVRATSNSERASIKINGASVGSGDLSSQIALNVGANTITVEVTAENGSTKKTYTLVVTRAAASNDAKLKSLLIAGDPLSSTELASGQPKNIKVADTVTSIKFTPTVNESHATIKINGRTMSSGVQTGSFNVVRGTNTFNIVVTAENAKDTKTYVVVVTRKVFSSNSKLKSLAISAGDFSTAFSSTKYGYTKTVPYATDRVTFTAIKDESNAAVSVDSQLVNGSSQATIELETGLNAIPVVVTAEDGSRTTYTVSITRTAPSTNSKLKSLSVSVGTLNAAFSASKLEYSVTVAYSVKELDLTLVRADSLANISVGTSKPDIEGKITVQPEVGPNTYSIQVTAENGTKTTYKLTVVRQSTADKIVVGTISIVGTPKVGQELTASIAKNGKGSPTPTDISYQWQRCGGVMAGQREVNINCKAITSAVGQKYTLQDSDYGYYIAVYVTASNGIDVGHALSKSTSGVSK